MIIMFNVPEIWDNPISYKQLQNDLKQSIYFGIE